MNRKTYVPILGPALSLALFLVQVLRRHGYQAMDSPLILLASALMVTTTVAGLWLAYSLFLSRFASIDYRRALGIDLWCHLPLLLCLA